LIWFDILDWVLNCFCGTTYDVITQNTKTWISLNRKKVFQKGKRHFSLLWKTFQISSDYFLLHRHFKMENLTKWWKIGIFFYYVKKTLLVNYFQKYTVKVPASSLICENLGKFDTAWNQPRWPMEFMQNCAFSTGQYRKKEICLDFLGYLLLLVLSIYI